MAWPNYCDRDAQKAFLPGKTLPSRVGVVTAKLCILAI